MFSLISPLFNFSKQQTKNACIPYVNYLHKKKQGSWFVSNLDTGNPRFLSGTDCLELPPLLLSLKTFYKFYKPCTDPCPPHTRSAAPATVYCNNEGDI